MAEAGEQNRMSQLREQVAKSRALKNQGVKFVVEDGSITGDKVIKAVKDGRVLGRMTLKPPSDMTNFKGAREIRLVDIEPDVRRQGIATSLFNEAKRLRLNPIHSNRLSTAGREFSTAQGGQRIPDPENLKYEIRAREANKAVSKDYGRRRAQELASERARLAARRSAVVNRPPSAITPDPAASETLNRLLGRRTGEASFLRPGVNWGGAANMGLGAFNILGFLPMLAEGGRIMSGRSVPPGIGAMN